MAPALWDLTDIQAVKDFLGKAGGADDVILQEIVSQESRRMATWMLRNVPSAAYSNVYLRAADRPTLQIPEWPVLAAGLVVREADNLTVVAASSYQVGPGGRTLVRVNAAGTFSTWTHVEQAPWDYVMDCTAGLADMDEDWPDLKEAATHQAVHVFKQTKAGGGRHGDTGSQVDSGGGGTYTQTPQHWYPGVMDVMDGYRTFRVGGGSQGGVGVGGGP